MVNCQFVCNQDLSVLISKQFDGASSGGKRYGAGQRRFSTGGFQKSSKSRDWAEKFTEQAT